MVQQDGVCIILILETLAQGDRKTASYSEKIIRFMIAIFPFLPGHRRSETFEGQGTSPEWKRWH